MAYRSRPAAHVVAALAPGVAETAAPQATRCVTIRVMYVNWYACREKASGLETEMVDVTAKALGRTLHLRRHPQGEPR